MEDVLRLYEGADDSGEPQRVATVGGAHDINDRELARPNRLAFHVAGSPRPIDAAAPSPEDKRGWLAEAQAAEVFAGLGVPVDASKQGAPPDMRGLLSVKECVVEQLGRQLLSVWATRFVVCKSEGPYYSELTVYEGGDEHSGIQRDGLRIVGVHGVDDRAGKRANRFEFHQHGEKATISVAAPSAGERARWLGAAA